jgi:hypothetical protein
VGSGADQAPRQGLALAIEMYQKKRMASRGSKIDHCSDAALEPVSADFEVDFELGPKTT